MNKYGREGIPIDWDAVKAMYVSGKSSRELGSMFGVIVDTVESRAKRGKWSILRRRALTAQQSALADPKLLPEAPKEPATITISSGNELLANAPTALPRGPRENASDQEIVNRALTLSDAVKFKTRVLAANDSALKILEENPPTNIGECDRFAEALTKVERIGARTFGYDREANQPAVNIAVLTSGLEYD